MLLSIGMIVKNERKYLRRCLEAITPILRELSSELIIADTGSTDGTVEIAREFTDNVFHFEWCNDFSAARNFTLEKAQGDWYMYLDADEIIENCNDIITFFNSGEYVNYNSATIAIKSKNKENQANGAVIIISRLAKRATSLRFINPIHERLEPIFNPQKNLDVIADHYGYVTENNMDFIKQKIDRNLSIMFSVEERNPSDCSNVFNICQAYMLAEDYPAALEYCDKGLRLAREQNDNLKYSFYANKALIYVKMNDTYKLLLTVDEYFRSKNTVLGTDIQMYIFQADCYVYFKAYKEAIEALKNYLTIFSEYKKGLHHTPDVYQSSVNFTDPSTYTTAAMYIVDLLFEIKDYEQAQIYSKLIDIADLQEDIPNLLRKLNQEIEIMKMNLNFSYLPKLYDKLDEETRSAFQEIIEQIAHNDEFNTAVLKAFYEASVEEDFYTKLMKLRYMYHSSSITAADVEAVLHIITECDTVYADLIYLVLFSGASIDLLNKKINAFDFVAVSHTSTLYYGQWARSLKKIDTNENDRADKHLWIAVLYECVLTAEVLRNDEKGEFFNNYTVHYKKYMQQIIKEEVLTDENAFMLPPPLRLGLMCSLAVGYRDDGQKANYIRCLKSIIKLNPGFKSVVQVLIDELEEAQKNQELNDYMMIVKNNIIALCNKNETQKALSIIASYEQLCPDDEEIKTIKKQLQG